MPPQTPSNRFQGRLEGLTIITSRRLLRLWDQIIANGGGEDEWIRAARPIATGAAVTAAGLAAAYAQIAAKAYATGTPSPLIVADAAARIHEPLLVVSQALGEGAAWAEATTTARSAVDGLGSNVVMNTGRQTVAERIPYVKAIRQLDANACDWCLSLSGVVWPSMDAASFGHTHCHCTPTPILDPKSLAAAVDHNDTAKAAAGWDDRKAATYKVRQQISRLRQSEQDAMARSKAAAKAARTETDPARLERLSIREQDWETRAERAAERRRILETGTNQLAA